MNRDRTLLLVGANDETVQKAAALGLHVLLLQHPSKLSAEQERLADRTLVLNYTDWDEVRPAAEELWTAPGFGAALSLTEAGLENAGRINDLFGLGGTGYEVAKRIRDKWAMRLHLAGLDPAAVAAAPLLKREDLDAFAARHGFPFIVKPADGTASLGVFRVGAPEDADRVWAEVERLRGTRTDRISTLFVLQDFLMEEYVDGPEFSVETFSFAGRHVVVAITEKFVDPRHFAELGHAVPARLDPAAAEQVRERVGGFLDLVGIRDGVCHTEVRIGARGPAVIESHNRVAGDAIPELVRGAYGIDLVTYALGWPFGLVPELPGPPAAKAGASTRFLVGDPGRVESVSGVEEALSRTDVLDVRLSVAPGDAVRALKDNWDRLGLVAVTGPDATTAIRRGAELIRDTVEIRIARDGGGSARARVAETGTDAPAQATRSTT
ncbi:ATP-grasp domain-containing protein [Streptomyces ziwulingensis]|uniref:ATP-grasp domain-containing protein n=1 Tax=Streptomyces ziwulingensis TaxID=1045501 RepID=A0ABP9D330_9ACTN